MSKICSKGNQLLRSRLLRETLKILPRNYSKDDDKDNKEEEGTQYKAGKGILSDKRQSIQEESYFHKEEKEQLKALKKRKLRKHKGNKEEKKD